MSINKTDSPNTPRQVPVFTQVIGFIQLAVNQKILPSNLVNFPRMDIELSGLESAPRISGETSDLNGSTIEMNEDFLEQLLGKIHKWIDSLVILNIPPQIIVLYYNYLMNFYPQILHPLVKGGNIVQTFGYNHDTFSLSLMLDGKEQSTFELFLRYQLYPTLGGSEEEKQKYIASLLKKAESNIEIVTAINTAAKVQCILEVGVNNGILRLTDPYTNTTNH